MYIKRSEDEYLPNWLKSHLNMNCPICGSPMLDYYNNDMELTGAKCSDDNCQGLLAARATHMFDLMNVKGVGYATALNYIKANGIHSNHVQLLSMLKQKPTVPLSTYLRIHSLPGVDSKWDEIVTRLHVDDFEDFMKAYPTDGKFYDVLKEYEPLLRSNLQYVNIKKVFNYQKPTHTEYLTIMITGTPNGFNSKDHFINFINDRMKGHIVVIHQATKRQTGVDYLIAEPGTTTRGKREAAIRGGIPIVSSEEFMKILLKKIGADIPE